MMLVQHQDYRRYVKIAITVPPSAVSRSGNRHTAARWSRFLRGLGHRVRVITEWDGGSDDMLLALHAYKSFPSMARFSQKRPQAPIVLALTGTDVYRDIRKFTEAKRALSLASRLIVLQGMALRELSPVQRRKARIVRQSSDTRLRHDPVKGRFRIAVVGHLRAEKDPFRAAMSLRYIDATAPVEVLQIGGALNRKMKTGCLAWQRRDSRYRWLGSLPHRQTIRLVSRSHVLVVSSTMEGGANVICEAARIGVPVLASKIPGNVGMLGQNYRGYFPLFDHEALSRLIERARTSPEFYSSLKRATMKRASLFAPALERSALKRAIKKLPRASGTAKAAPMRKRKRIRT